MSKIVQAVNSMISHPELISTPIMNTDNSEIFFTYKSKYKWSMRRNEDGDQYLYFYPGKQKLEELARMDIDDWQGFSEMASYGDKSIGTREARASFTELYDLLKEKLFGLDQVLDDIIDT